MKDMKNFNIMKKMTLFVIFFIKEMEISTWMSEYDCIEDDSELKNFLSKDQNTLRRIANKSLRVLNPSFWSMKVHKDGKQWMVNWAFLPTVKAFNSDYLEKINLILMPISTFSLIWRAFSPPPGICINF